MLNESVLICTLDLKLSVIGPTSLLAHLQTFSGHKILPVVEAFAAFRAAWSPVLRSSTASVKIAVLGRHPHDAGFQLVING